MRAASVALTAMGDAHPALARMSEARGILAETRSIDVCKAIRDDAEAVRVYMRQKELGLQAEQYAAEIRVRAEYRMGALLAEMPKAQGERTDRATGTSSARRTKSRVLREAGIARQRAAEYERLARLKEEALEEGIRAATEKGEAVTTKGLLRLVTAQEAQPTQVSARTEVLAPPESPPHGAEGLPSQCPSCGSDVLIQVWCGSVGGKPFHKLFFVPPEKDGQDWYPGDE